MILYRQCSGSATVENGIVQGSVISLTLFNITIHEIANDTHPDVNYIMFADDITFFSSNVDPKNKQIILYTTNCS